MPLLVWLIVWLIKHNPPVLFSPHWNSWAIALVICGALSIIPQQYGMKL
jgi:hypothetical protein